jgi:hypothetical protein
VDDDDHVDPVDSGNCLHDRQGTTNHRTGGRMLLDHRINGRDSRTLDQTYFMKVIAVEVGDRPDLATKARIIAPQAAKFLGSQLEDKTFADIAEIVIDWDGDMHWSGSGPMPEELRKSIMYVWVHKYYPQINRWLKVDYNLDLEEMFGRDEAKAEDLFEIIENLETKVREEEKKRIN